MSSSDTNGTVPRPVNPGKVAARYRQEVREEIDELGKRPHIVLFLTGDDTDSVTYAEYTTQACDDVGIEHELRHVARLDLEAAITDANADPSIHGIFVYWPVFNNEQDAYIRNQVDYRKDIEGLGLYWTRKLYANDRHAIDGDTDKKAILPCTPLAIIKLLTEAGVYDTGVDKPIRGKQIVVFNRSEIVGRPLAVMLSNDGAVVHSFDIHGPLLFADAQPYEVDITREDALMNADIVITGVPNPNFERIDPAEIKAGAVCLNFSSSDNFYDNVTERASLYIPRVGPVTVAMCMRNALRLYKNFHEK